MRTYPTLFLFVCLLCAGCVSPRKVVFIEAPVSELSEIREMRADGDTLQITIVQQGAGIWIAGVTAEVIDGDVYLSTTAISSVVPATEFTVDMSAANVPRDWQSRLYWIVGGAITSPVNPFVEHVREIRRAKIQLPYEKAQTPTQ